MKNTSGRRNNHTVASLRPDEMQARLDRIVASSVDKLAEKAQGIIDKRSKQRLEMTDCA